MGDPVSTLDMASHHPRTAPLSLQDIESLLSGRIRSIIIF